jgi:hypothetical protein
VALKTEISPNMESAAKKIEKRIEQMLESEKQEVLRSAAIVNEASIPEPPVNTEDSAYDSYVDVLSAGKYGGELWADAEREKIRAQLEVRLSSRRNNDTRLTASTERLRRAVEDQRAIEDEFPAAKKWGTYYISLEAVNAQQAEANTP